MKRKFIQILIIFISIAFLGLILIQLYWINNSIILRGAEFNHAVNRAMDRVVSRLTEQAVWSTEKADLDWMEGERFVDSNEQYLLSDSTTTEPTIEYDSLLQIDDSISRDVLGQMDNTQQQILEQSGLLEDVQSGRLTIDVLADISQELDPLYLDSLLLTELKQKGINTKFAFGVFTWHDHPEILNDEDEKWLEGLVGSGYRKAITSGDSREDIYYLKLFFPHQQRYLLQTMWFMLSISAILMLSILFAFLYTINTILRQKKISEVKNDFINNMTHELKTPISTIGLACEALNDPVMRSSEKQLKTFVGMINTENKRLGALVENVLRSAILDRGDIQLQKENLNMHEVIQAVVRNLAIQVNKKGGSIKTAFNAFNPVIKGDRIHLTNLTYNLIDNAIKYSSENPFLLIETEDIENGIRIRFTDHGIGISKENQRKIFEKLYRVPTGDVHDVKGFGLGLSYVKAIVEKHHGDIFVESELEKGSTFTIELPFDHEDEH